MSKKPNDADKIAGLATILQMGNKQPEKPATPPSPALPAVAPTVTVDIAPPSSVRKKVGKYRDPNWHHYGVYLRKETHKLVTRRLEDTDSGLDLSELLQQLMEQWLKAD